MIPKPKKHKQRFEHMTVTVDRQDVKESLLLYEKIGYELADSIPLSPISDYITLFFKRPV